MARTSSEGFKAASAGGGTPRAFGAGEFVFGTSYLDTTTDEVFVMLTLADGTQFSDSNTDATLQLVGDLQTLIGAQTCDDLIIDSGGWSGDIAAFIVYNRTLSGSELADVTEALRQAYVIPEPASLALLLTCGIIPMLRHRQ